MKTPSCRSAMGLILSYWSSCLIGALSMLSCLTELSYYIFEEFMNSSLSSLRSRGGSWMSLPKIFLPSMPNRWILSWTFKSISRSIRSLIVSISFNSFLNLSKNWLLSQLESSRLRPLSLYFSSCMLLWIFVFAFESKSLSLRLSKDIRADSTIKLFCSTRFA